MPSGFKAAPEFFTRSAGIFTGAADQARSNTLESAIASGASGIEGTKTAASLRHLGARLAHEVETFAAEVEETAQKARASGIDYHDQDENVAAGLRNMAR